MNAEKFSHTGLCGKAGFLETLIFASSTNALSHKHSCTKTDAIGLVCPFAVQHNIMPAFQGRFLARGHRNFYFFLLLPPSPLSFLTYAQYRPTTVPASLPSFLFLPHKKFSKSRRIRFFFSFSAKNCPFCVPKGPLRKNAADAV